MSQTQTEGELCNSFATTEDDKCFQKVNLFYLHQYQVRKKVSTEAKPGLRCMEYSTVSNVSHFFRTLSLGFSALFARCSFDKKESKHAFHWKPLELYMTSHHTKIHRESIKNVKCQSFCSISRIILVQLLRLRENLNIFSLHRFKCLRAGLCFRGRAKVY